MHDEIKKYIDEQLDIIRKLCDICNKCKLTKLTYPPPTTYNVGSPYCKTCNKNESNKDGNDNIKNKLNDEIYKDDDMVFGLFD